MKLPVLGHRLHSLEPVALQSTAQNGLTALVVAPHRGKAFDGVWLGLVRSEVMYAGCDEHGSKTASPEVRVDADAVNVADDAVVRLVVVERVLGEACEEPIDVQDVNAFGLFQVFACGVVLTEREAG